MSVRRAQFRVLLLVHPHRSQSRSTVLHRLVHSLKWRGTRLVQDAFLLLTAAINPSLPQCPALAQVPFFERVLIQNPNLDHRHDHPGVPGPLSPNSVKNLFFPSRRSNQCKRRHPRTPRMRYRQQAMTVMLHQKVPKAWESSCKPRPTKCYLATRPCT